MRTEQDDLVELSDHVWQRLRDRLDGTTDDEYRWDPGITTMAWRLGHVRDMLTEQRNWTWLGLHAPEPPAPGSPTTADTAVAGLADAYDAWRGVLVAVTDLAAPIGTVAGRYGSATRRSFVHHVLDELIHHGAELAMLRDLYAVRLA